MSWDILIQDFPEDAVRISDISDDFAPGMLGKRSDLIAAVQAVFPTADFSDPSWGNFTTSDHSIEFNIGRSEDCDSMMLHVRGGGEAAAAVETLLTALKRRAMDCQTGDFFSLAAAQRSFAQWQAFRDRVTGKDAPSAEETNF